MLRVIERQEIEVCDFCRNKGCLNTCDVCHRRYCLTDHGVLPGSFGFTTLCRECARREDVQAIGDRFAAELMPIFKQRDEALQALYQG